MKLLERQESVGKRSVPYSFLLSAAFNHSCDLGIWEMLREHQELFWIGGATEFRFRSGLSVVATRMDVVLPMDKHDGLQEVVMRRRKR